MFERHVLVKGLQEQNKLMEVLDKYNYHWLSGQVASDVPAFLKMTPEVDLHMVMAINDENKTIGFIPMEVYSASDQELILRDCIPAKNII